MSERPIEEGDWVTNLDPMLGEPHEVIGVDYEGLLVCVESHGHTVRVSPWDVERCESPDVQRRAWGATA